MINEIQKIQNWAEFPPIFLRKTNVEYFFAVIHWRSPFWKICIPLDVISFSYYIFYDFMRWFWSILRNSSSIMMKKKSIFGIHYVFLILIVFVGTRYGFMDSLLIDACMQVTLFHLDVSWLSSITRHFFRKKFIFDAFEIPICNRIRRVL